MNLTKHTSPYSSAKKMLLVLFFIACAVARTPEIYCIYTDFGPLNEQTIVVSGRLNVYNGTVTKQNTLFTYLGGSGTYDGISAFDQKSGSIFWVNDFANSYIWGTQVDAPIALLPPIYLEDNGVVALTFDWKNRMLIATDYIAKTKTSRFIVYPVDNVNLGPKVTNLPSSVFLGAGAFDPERAEYYNIATNGSAFVLTTLNISSGAILRSAPSCAVDKLWVEGKHADFESRLWGFAANFTDNKLHYDLVNINPDTRACLKLPVPSDGIVTASGFDHYTGVLYYIDATDAGNFLRSTDTRTGHSESVKMASPYGCSDLAVRFVE